MATLQQLQEAEKENLEIVNEKIPERRFGKGVTKEVQQQYQNRKQIAQQNLKSIQENKQILKENEQNAQDVKDYNTALYIYRMGNNPLPYKGTRVYHFYQEIKHAPGTAEAENAKIKYQIDVNNARQKQNTIMIEGVGGMSVAPEKQDAVVTSYTNKGYNVIKYKFDEDKKELTGIKFEPVAPYKQTNEVYYNNQNFSVAPGKQGIFMVEQKRMEVMSNPQQYPKQSLTTKNLNKVFNNRIKFGEYKEIPSKIALVEAPISKFMDEKVFPNNTIERSARIVFPLYPSFATGLTKFVTGRPISTASILIFPGGGIYRGATIAGKFLVGVKATKIVSGVVTGGSLGYIGFTKGTEYYFTPQKELGYKLGKDTLIGALSWKAFERSYKNPLFMGKYADKLEKVVSNRIIVSRINSKVVAGYGAKTMIIQNGEKEAVVTSYLITAYKTPRIKETLGVKRFLVNKLTGKQVFKPKTEVVFKGAIAEVTLKPTRVFDGQVFGGKVSTKTYLVNEPLDLAYLKMNKNSMPQTYSLSFRKNRVVKKDFLLSGGDRGIEMEAQQLSNIKLDRVTRANLRKIFPSMTTDNPEQAVQFGDTILVNINKNTKLGKRTTRGELASINKLVAEKPTGNDIGEINNAFYKGKIAVTDVTFPKLGPGRLSTQRMVGTEQVKTIRTNNPNLLSKKQSGNIKPSNNNIQGTLIQKQVNFLTNKKLLAAGGLIAKKSLNSISKNKASLKLISQPRAALNSISAFYGKGLYERTNEVQSLSPISRAKLNIRLDNKLTSSLRTESQTKQTTKNIFKQAQNPGLRLRQRSVNINKVPGRQLLNIPFGMPKQAMPNPIKIPTKPTRPNPPKTPFIAKPNFKMKPSSKVGRGEAGFNSFIKRFGKFIKIGGLTSRGTALKKGQQKALSGLGATFKIEKTGLMIPKGKNNFNVSNKFRDFRISNGKKIKLNNMFIQKRGTRLSSRGELKEIQSARRNRLI